MLRSRKFWKVGVGYFTSDSATLISTQQLASQSPTTTTNRRKDTDYHLRSYGKETLLGIGDMRHNRKETWLRKKFAAKLCRDTHNNNKQVEVFFGKTSVSFSVKLLICCSASKFLQNLNLRKQHKYYKMYTGDAWEWELISNIFMKLQRVWDNFSCTVTHN